MNRGYLLRLKASGRAPVDVLVESQSLPRLGDELNLGEQGGITAVDGLGRLGGDPPSTFWVEAVVRLYEPHPDAPGGQLRELPDPLVVASDRPYRIGEKGARRV